MFNNIVNFFKKMEIKKYKVFKRALLFFIIALLMFVSFEGGLYLANKEEFVNRIYNQESFYFGKILNKYGQISSNNVSQDVDFNLFWKVWDTLKENYVDRGEITDKKMFYGALQGMVSSLGDPYTVFMEPKDAQEFADDLAGTFEGIGAEIGIKKDILTIIAPLPDMPAEKAGLKAGDKVYAINGEATAGMTIDEAVQKIRGKKGTTVTLSISRDGMEDVKDFVVNRDTIVVKSVRTTMRDDKIMVIKISNFNGDTEALFNQATEEVIAANPKGVILDLRNDPGGYLDTAIEVASEWVEDKLVVTEKYSEEKDIKHLSRGRARLKSFPTVVLVNQGSASASEIVAGALKDYGLATILGKQTFGKGSVQTLMNLEDGSSIKITVAKWLTPNGVNINKEGISPDEEVDLTLEDFTANEDPQLDRAIEIINGSPVKRVKATSTPEIKK